jgi:hypothetical protein
MAPFPVSVLAVVRPFIGRRRCLYFFALSRRPGLCGLRLVVRFLERRFGTDIFGIYMMSYILTVFGTAFLVRVLYRHNWKIVFPVVFAGQLLNNHLVFILRLFLGAGPLVSYARFFGRTFLQALGTTLLGYLFFLFFKKCEPESTE